MEVAIPFTVTVDNSNISSDGAVQVLPRVLSADTRAINPRKVYIRVELAMGVRVFAPNACELVSGCSLAPEKGIQEKQENLQVYLTAFAQEKHFTFSDDLSLPATKPGVTELLRPRVDFLCAESKVIGNKLIFKGQVLLAILYKSGEELTTVSFELPFSQILEVPGASEAADCECNLLLNDFSCRADPEDDRIISVSLDLSAQVILREERNLEVMTDLYSTDYELNTQMKKDIFCRLGEHGIRRQTVREVFESPIAVKSVVDNVLTVGRVAQIKEGGQTTFTADVRVSLLFRGEDEQLYAMTKALPVSQQWEENRDCRYFCCCWCPGEFYATPTLGGIEVRFPLDFDCRTELTQEVFSVCEANLQEDSPLDKAQQPSIILRLVEAQESLWDIAKAYSATSEDIINANGLTDSCLPEGKLLLIPKKR